MGARGPAPTPTDILKARGSWRGKARDKRKEPKPGVDVPECPDWLDEEAELNGLGVTPRLVELKVISIIDRAALVCYCQAWSDLKSSSQILQEQGLTFKTSDGYLCQHPAVSIREKSRAAVLRFSQEFGLTPASRSRVTTAKSDDDSEDDVDDRMLG